jgi:hypothetical protein
LKEKELAAGFNFLGAPTGDFASVAGLAGSGEGFRRSISFFAVSGTLTGSGFATFTPKGGIAWIFITGFLGV